MNGHQLRPTQMVKDDTGRTVFRAACTCMDTGVWFYAPRLPDLWAMHDNHLRQLETRSRRNHPSGWAARRHPDELAGDNQ